MECRSATDDEPIRQGDIIEWNEAPNENFGRWGVIVTADCDLAWDKHRGILTYVPIIELHRYFHLYHLPEKVEREQRLLTESAISTIRQQQEKNRPDFPRKMSEDVAADWISRSTGERIVKALNIKAEKKRQEVIDAVNLIQESRQLDENSDVSVSMDLLIRIRSKRTAKQIDKIREEVSKGMVNHAESLPGDMFFIGSLTEKERSAGYVVCLRILREVRHDAIAVRQSDLEKEGVKGRRVARLTSPYVYRLTQQISEVFAAIGLPAEYERDRRSKAESVVEARIRPGNEKD